jgi:hypothetical protein
MASLRAYLRLMRPHQWLKNGFVFVGLLFGHGWSEPELVVQALVLFAGFCFASSAVYVSNDIADREADRAHPEKRRRPIASGQISVRGAAVAGVLLCAAGLALAAWVSWQSLAIVVCYIALNIAYSAGLKHVAILDVFLIAAGFMLRILAGTLGLGIEPSNWLLFCGLMLTLFLGFSKRRAEYASLDASLSASEPGKPPVPQRRSLAGYSAILLDRMLAITAAGTAIGYGLYTIAPQTILLHGTNKLILTLPFVLYGLFRYLFLVHRRGGGGDPAWELLHDPHLLAATAGWFGLTCWVLAG